MFGRCITFALVLGSLALSAGAQTAAPDPNGLASMIPAKAVFYVEHSGHDAVRQAFGESNLGQMYKDQAIQDFVQDTRVGIGKMFLKHALGMADDKEIEKYHAHMHNMLKPFWYSPAAVFVVYEKGQHHPSAGFICTVGDKYKADAKAGLDAMTAYGVPAKGQSGTRQAFTLKTGSVTWTGVAMSSNKQEWTLPREEKKQRAELEDKDLFMSAWVGKNLLIATSLPTADALGESIDKPGKGFWGNESFQVVMKKTTLKDWSFRWFVDVAAIHKIVDAKKAENTGNMPEFGKILGLGNVRGVGGSAGFADKVYTRPTYFDSPRTQTGLLRLFKAGGSYKSALAMAPGSANIVLAGQVDQATLIKSLQIAFAEGNKRPGVVEGPGNTAASMPADEKRVLGQVTAMVNASNGDFAFFVNDLDSIISMIGGGGPPVGVVIGMKDAANGQKALDELIAMTGGKSEEQAKRDQALANKRKIEATASTGNATSQAAAGEVKIKTDQEVYQKVVIQKIAGPIVAAAMKDRLIIAASQSAMRSAIDTAIDKTGGFEPKGKAAQMAALAGDGSGVFMLDLAALAKMGWPFVMKMSSSEEMSAEFPLKSVPSTEKLVKYLGPEVAVFQSDDGGLLIKGRGKIPFVTKIIASYPALGMGMYWVFMDFHGPDGQSPVAPPPPPPPTDKEF